MIRIVYYDEGTLPLQSSLNEDNFRASLLYNTTEEAIVSLKQIMKYGIEHAYYNPDTQEYQNGRVSQFVILLLHSGWEEELYRGCEIEDGVKAMEG